MKKSRWIFLVGILLVGYSWYMREKPTAPIEDREMAVEQEELEDPVNESPEREVVPEPKMIKKIQARKNQAPIKKSDPKKKAPSRPNIEFKMIGKFAVAQGDIILGTVSEYMRDGKGITKAQTIKYWPKGVVPYVIDPGVERPERVLDAFEIINQASGAQFVERKEEKNFLFIEVGDEHCLSQLGFQGGGGQRLFLSPKCEVQQVLHELMHTLGFIHEQSRPDRDQYIRVLWENVDEDYKLNFKIVPDNWVQAQSLGDFDFKSVMIYEAMAFSISSALPTLNTVRLEDEIEPSKEGLSAGDVAKLRSVYGAPQ